MDYDWDEEKSARTRAERGFGFEALERFRWDFACCADVQFVDGEERELWLGPIDDNLYAVVVTRRGETLRVISLRVATNAEKRDWRKSYE